MQFTNFLLVLVVAVAIASCVGALYASGLRLLVGDAGNEGHTPGGRKALAYLCFAACIAIILYALYLIIPVFH